MTDPARSTSYQAGYAAATAAITYGGHLMSEFVDGVGEEITGSLRDAAGQAGRSTVRFIQESASDLWNRSPSIAGVETPPTVSGVKRTVDGVALRGVRRGNASRRSITFESVGDPMEVSTMAPPSNSQFESKKQEAVAQALALFGLKTQRAARKKAAPKRRFRKTYRKTWKPRPTYRRRKYYRRW